MGNWEEKVAQPDTDHQQRARVGRVSQGTALTRLSSVAVPQSRAGHDAESAVLASRWWLLLQPGGGKACFYLAN